MNRLRRTRVLAAACGALLSMTVVKPAASDTFGSGANAFNIEFVNIGNPGNAADTSSDLFNPTGSVASIYNMGKFEVSRDMITKANSAAGLGIPLADMTSNGGNGASRPATGMSLNEAVRFINWLNTSTGNMPAYKFAIQPGQAGYSSNTNIQLWTISDAGYDPNNLYRNSLAKYFLPSSDEWHKAAYYDPASSVYYDYPTGSDIAPTAVASGTAAGTAVYDHQSGPADITLAGGLSPYGTMAQGGNVFEPLETNFDLVNGSRPTSRWLKGGTWYSDYDKLRPHYVDFDGPPTFESWVVGFRVASQSGVPEPSAFLLAAMALVPFSWRRRGVRNRAAARVSRISLMAFAFGAVGISSVSLAQSVISGPIISPVNSHTYYLLEPATWTASEARALALGGHLATVRNLTENNWIYSQFSAFSFGGKTSRGLWIGLTDAKTEGVYKWSSGEPFSYSNWGTGEPANQDGFDDYVHLLWPGDPRQSKWNDIQNVSSYASIPISGVVEVAPVPEPSALALAALATLSMLVRRGKTPHPAGGQDCLGAGPKRVTTRAATAAD